MYRKCLDKLIEWAERDTRGVMVLRGARQGAVKGMMLTMSINAGMKYMVSHAAHPF